MNFSTRNCRRLGATRAGAALIALITLLSVITLLAAVWARKIVVEHRHQRSIEELSQVRWLVDSGLSRAAAQIAASSTFVDEQWHIPATDLGRAHDALVTLHAEPLQADGQFRLTVEARYPATDPKIKRSKTVTFSPPVPSPAP